MRPQVYRPNTGVKKPYVPRPTTIGKKPPLVRMPPSVQDCDDCDPIEDVTTETVGQLQQNRRNAQNLYWHHGRSLDANLNYETVYRLPSKGKRGKKRNKPKGYVAYKK